MIYVNGDDSLDDVQEAGKSPSENDPCNIASSSGKQRQSDAHKSLDLFWPNVLEDIKRIKSVDAKNQNLPLARIKKIMKLDENAKMIAAEAPLLFAKACEIFIQELTLRAWIHTEDNKRRTLQRSDIATAISRYDQFDFLIDIVPREDIKPRKESESTKSSSAQPSEHVQYYLHLAQQQHQQTIQNPTQSNTASTIVNQTIPVATGSGTVANVTVATAPQNILLATTANPAAGCVTSTVAGATTTTVQPTFVNSLQSPQQQIQILQQMVTPTGEITHVPITINANQLNLLRMQLQSNNANASQVQQMIIPTIQAQQQPSIVQVSGNAHNVAAAVAGASGGIFINTAPQSTVSVSTAGGISGSDTTKQHQNIINTFRGNC